MRHIIYAVVAVGAFSAMPAFANNETAKATTADAADPNQAIRCRRVDVTGSLVKKGKVCKTVAQWRAIMENNNTLARKMVEDGTTRSGGQ
jgi:hypothetical protein